MGDAWNQARLQQYIDGRVEESSTLEYKSAGALDVTDAKKIEITKDVSAMANAAGGIIIYGIQEHGGTSSRHLPDRIDPIDRRQFSKEWLEQVINTIEPRISGFKVHPIEIDGDPLRVVYAVEVPKSTTAHQARDQRYYRRYNFERLPMHDHEIRDVMNRASTPDVHVTFGYQCTARESHMHKYRLTVLVENRGMQAANHFKLQLAFPAPGLHVSCLTYPPQHPNHERVAYWRDGDDHLVAYRSREVLFPQDTEDLDRYIILHYRVDAQSHRHIHRQPNSPGMSLRWALYADNMTPKTGEVPLEQLEEF